MPKRRGDSRGFEGSFSLGGSLLDIFETAAEEIKQTKLRVAGVWCALFTLLGFGTFLVPQVIEEIGFTHEVNTNQQPIVLPLPARLGFPFHVCETGTVVQVEFPSETLPADFNNILGDILLANGNCNWVDVGPRMASSVEEHGWLGTTRYATSIARSMRSVMSKAMSLKHGAKSSEGRRAKSSICDIFIEL